MTNKNTVKYGGITLDKVNQNNSFVPGKVQKIELAASDKRALAIAIKNNIPALLVGETGTGKTSAIKEIASKLGQGYTRISLTGYTSPDDLIGSKSAKDGSTYYENGILTKAMLDGHIVVFDELNAITPECSFIFHGLLDDDKQITLPNGDVIVPHKDFRVFATINPEYEGTRSLNRAFLDRFGIIIYINILKPAAEKKLLVDRMNISPELSNQLVALAWLNRKAYNEHKTLTLISTRSLLQIATLINEGLSIKDAYTAAVVNKARIDEKSAFLDFYNMIFSSNEEYKDVMPEVLTPEEIKMRENQLNSLNETNRNLYDQLRTAESEKINLDRDVNELRTLNSLLSDKVNELQAKINKTSTATVSDAEIIEKTPATDK